MNYKNRILQISMIALLGLVVLSCNNSNKQTKQQIASSTSEVTGNYAVAVTMKNKTHTLRQKELNPVGATFEKDTLQFVFYTNDNPFQLNLNLNNTDIINKGSATYKIADANAKHTTVDLNFYDAEREKKNGNRRIVFRKGTIYIKQLTKNKLQMTFDGEGGGMLNFDETFPISGKVNVTY